MKISSKLMIIVALTFFEINLTLWSIFEVAKGATFHQLNFLHLKYSSIFSNEITNIENGSSSISIAQLKFDINNIKQQPIDCLDQVNALNLFMMKQIGTDIALDICKQDIQSANRILAYLDKFSEEIGDRDSLVQELKVASDAFNENSILFEKPIVETVAFIMRTIIPLVIIVSFFNILFITYMSRNIKSSISSVINLLSNPNSKESLDIEIDKNVTGELKTLLDVAKKRVIKELMVIEINQKLESLVEKRTLNLTRANEELAQFAYRVSHDLKAPLTSTKRLAQFIKEDIKDGELNTALNDTDKIISQMIKLEQLVMGILALTEADSSEKELVEIDFESILLELKSTTSELQKDNNCTFIVDINVQKPMKNEKVRIVQILENLVSNAIKYSYQNQEQSFVKTSVLEESDSYVIQVEDNGLGIPKSRQGEVFQMFKRFHPNVSFGSGLGMAIVKKHVDYMGGTIEMKSSGTGTIFTIVFEKEIVK
ncbi:HAMP domain-containing sensor histidine kinase [uncultured Psychrosphaera sp.]|uniref:sensor histidine kinase n=1 Tax=uncultured Psychrosphaera sp. TaxID=1403522 RepID=UPI00260E6B60|nr:HAMP domain-containing sensor histidine kinase [uncultured Psychrosphaera sp.]